MSKNPLRPENVPGAESYAVHFTTASVLIGQWQVLRRWQPDPAFKSLLVRVLQECAVSVAHAQAIVDVFEEEVPTPKEIRETALNLRPRFSQQPDPRIQWREKYGEPSPVKTDIATPVQTQEQKETAALIAAYGKEWAIKASYPARYAALLELGFKLTPEIRNWYGEMIATEKQRLPPRKTAAQ